MLDLISACCRGHGALILVLIVSCIFWCVLGTVIRNIIGTVHPAGKSKLTCNLPSPKNEEETLVRLYRKNNAGT